MSGNTAHIISGRLVKAGAVVALAFTAACGIIRTSEDQIVFDGQVFRAKAKPVDRRNSPTDFTVVVSDVSKSLQGAREAGRFEGTKFCVQNFGSSRIAWTVGPDSDPENLRISDDKLVFVGRCQRP